MPRGYDLARLARLSGHRRSATTLRPIGARKADSAALKAIFVAALYDDRAEREAVLRSAVTAQAALTQDDIGYREAMRLYRQSQETRLSRAKTAITGFVSKVASRFDASWIAMVKAALGIDLRFVIQSSDLRATVGLVTDKIAAHLGGLADDLAKRVETGLLALIVQRSSPAEKAKALADAYTKSRKAAGRAAKAEIETFNAVLNQFRQRQAGITHYEWWTREDERVRGRPGGLYPRVKPSHWARHAKPFAWDRPPEGGHPGEAFGCRCVARPVITLKAQQPRQPAQSRARTEGLRAVAEALGVAA